MAAHGGLSNQPVSSARVEGRTDAEPTQVLAHTLQEGTDCLLTGFFFLFLSFFFFWPLPRHVEVPGLEVTPTPRQ